MTTSDPDLDSLKEKLVAAKQEMGALGSKSGDVKCERRRGRAGAGLVRYIRADVRARACREFYEKQNEVITHRLEIIEKIEATRTLVLDKAARRREVSEVELHKIWKEEADESEFVRACLCAIPNGRVRAKLVYAFKYKYKYKIYL